MDSYEFNVVGSELYSFIWNDFCDWYIELAKHHMNNTTKSVLLKVLTSILKMMHPFMPFVTEEIYSILPIKDAESIMISSYPKVEKEYIFDTNFDEVLELITKVRRLKLENNIGKEYYLVYNNEFSNMNVFKNMLKLEDNFTSVKPDGNLTSISINNNLTLYYDGSSNKKAELEALTKEKTRLESSIARREKLLSNENYVSKAPKNIVDNERKSLEKEKEELELILQKL